MTTPLLARTRCCAVAGTFVLALVLAPAAQAGWRAPQTLDAARSFGGPVALATAPSGHAVAVWESARNGLRVAVAQPGRSFSRSRAIAGSVQEGLDVRVAVAPSGRAIVAFEYHDGSFFDPTDLRGDGCCHGTKVAIVAPAGAVTAARAVRPRGNVSPLTAIAAGSSRFGVLVGGSIDGGVRFVPVSASGRPGSPRTVAAKGSGYDGASLQFAGRRALAGLTSIFPARVAVSSQRAGGAFSAPKVAIRVPADITDGFLPSFAVTPDGRGRNVVASTTGPIGAVRVRLARVDAVGRVSTLAGPAALGPSDQLTAPAVGGGAVALAYGQGRRLRLVTRSATGRLRRRTLSSLGTNAGQPQAAIGGGAIAITTIPTSLGRTLAPRVFYLRSAAARPSVLRLATRAFSAGPVIVDGRGRVRVLYRDPDGRLKTRLRTL